LTRLNIILLLLIVGNAFSQDKTVSTLILKGDSLQELENWSQSRYFYALANKECIQTESCTFLISQSIKEKIESVD